MFLQACVSHSVHRRGTIPACNWVAPPGPRWHSPQTQTEPPPQTWTECPLTWTELPPGPGQKPDPDRTSMDPDRTPGPRLKKTPHPDKTPSPPGLDGTPPQVYKRAARILVECFLILFTSCCKMKTGKLCMWFREK